MESNTAENLESLTMTGGTLHAKHVGELLVIGGQPSKARSIIPFDRLIIVKWKNERMYTSPEIHPRVQEIYFDRYRNVSTEPPSEGEKRPFNALKTCFTDIIMRRGNNGIECLAAMAPMRYLLGKAYRDFVDEGDFSQAEYEKWSLNAANTSLIQFVVDEDNKYYLVARIKAKDFLGKGEVHTSVCAFNIDASYLKNYNPLVTALNDNLTKKTGIDYSKVKMKPAGFINEKRTGQINCAYVAEPQPLKVVHNQLNISAKNGNTTFAGITYIPVDGHKTGTTPNGEFVFHNLKVWRATESGLVEQKDKLSIPGRPFSSCVMDKYSLSWIMEKTGIKK